jgi:hypothetical protein
MLSPPDQAVFASVVAGCVTAAGDTGASIVVISGLPVGSGFTGNCGIRPPCSCRWTERTDPRN